MFLCSFNWKCKPLWTYELMDGKNNERGSFERRKNYKWMVERGTQKHQKKWVTSPYVTGGLNTFIYWMGFNCCNIIKNIIIIIRIDFVTNTSLINYILGTLSQRTVSWQRVSHFNNVHVSFGCVLLFLLLFIVVVIIIIIVAIIIMIDIVNIIIIVFVVVIIINVVVVLVPFWWLYLGYIKSAYCLNALPCILTII